MKNVLKNYNEYLSGKKRIESELEKELKFARNNYSGEFLKQKETELKGIHASKLNSLNELHIQGMNSEFDSTKSRMKSVIMKPIPENTMLHPNFFTDLIRSFSCSVISN